MAQVSKNITMRDTAYWDAFVYSSSRRCISIRAYSFAKMLAHIGITQSLLPPPIKCSLKLIELCKGCNRGANTMYDHMSTSSINSTMLGSSSFSSCVSAIVCPTVPLRSTDIPRIVDGLRRPWTASPRFDVDGPDLGSPPGPMMVVVVRRATAARRAHVSRLLLAKRLAPASRTAEVEAGVEQPAE